MDSRDSWAFLKPAYLIFAERKRKGSDGWKRTAVLPAKTAPPVRVSFFGVLRACP
jgi:hypothetical protein